jgi:hypothetical protein
MNNRIEFTPPLANLLPMRPLLLLLLVALAPAAAHAAGPRVYKVLPQFLDANGRASLTPSLYDRDAYQAVLRSHPEKCTALRFYVQWNAPVTRTNEWKLRVELRGVPAGEHPKQAVIELLLPLHHGFSRWDSVVLKGDDYKAFGDVTAWRTTLWDGDQLLDEQKSFLW